MKNLLYYMNPICPIMEPPAYLVNKWEYAEVAPQYNLKKHRAMTESLHTKPE